eukprot:gene1135-1239_t
MSPLNFSFLEEEDIFQMILLDWLHLRDWLMLDIALAHRPPQREQLLRVLRSLPMEQPFLGDSALWQKNEMGVFTWRALHQVWLSAGCWEVRRWHFLSSSQEINYEPILERMVDMRLSGVRDEFRLSELSVCPQLRRLAICGLQGGNYQTHPSPSHGSQRLPFCPKLTSLSMHSCFISSSLSAAFAHCEHLVHAEYWNSRCGDGSGSERNSSVETSYFQRLRSLVIAGSIAPMILSHFPRDRVFSLRQAVLSGLVLDGQNITAALADFLTRCPHLEDLTLMICTFNFHSILKVIRERMHKLERLRLDRCIHATEGLRSEATAILCPGERLHALSISPVTPRLNESLDIVLELCGQFVRDLTISLCFGMRPSVYATIRCHLPFLTSLTVKYHGGPGDSLAHHVVEHVAEIQKIFCNQSHTRVTLVKKWVDKERNERETVVLDAAKLGRV